MDLTKVSQQYLDLHPLWWLQVFYQLIHDRLRNKRIWLALSAYHR
jgi:hypothetical protein